MEYLCLHHLVRLLLKPYAIKFEHRYTKHRLARQEEEPEFKLPRLLLNAHLCLLLVPQSSYMSYGVKQHLFNVLSKRSHPNNQPLLLTRHQHLHNSTME